MLMTTDNLLELYNRVDKRVAGFMSHYGVTILRLALAVIFIWFGALKIFGVSPVNDLVGTTVYWVDPGWFVVFLGVWELLIGIGLLFRFALRLTLLLLFVQLAGTFLVFVFQPEVTFVRGNPLLLTVTGEFVVKNLVLIAAGIVIGGTVEHGRGMLGPEETREQMT